MKTSIFLYIALLALLAAASAKAAEPDDSLGLYSDWQEQTVSIGRAPRQVSHTPENITVITAAEISALNAHTLADVLATVPGLQLDSHGGTGGIAYTNIQSSQFNHVLVLVDGIPLNNLADNFSDVGLVPARIIERIEIVKGAASAAWGQALGGVINVITKTPATERSLAGSVSASLGERKSSDSGAELSGTRDRLGYFLSGGYLGSNGLRPGTQLNNRNGYAKLTYDLPSRGSLTSSFSYTSADRGQFVSSAYDMRAADTDQYLNVALLYRQPLASRLDLELSARHTLRRNSIETNQFSSNELLQDSHNKETASGAGLKLIADLGANQLVFGGEYEHAELNVSDALMQVDLLSRQANRWGAYLNDALTIGPITFSGGGRFDRTVTGGDQVSSSLGATWRINNSTLLRGYTAKGYSLPALVYNRTSEKVWTSQIGVESSSLPYLWLKATLFRNRIWDVAAINQDSGESFQDKRLALGYELETRTTPLYHISLGAGYTYTNTTGSDGHMVSDLPSQTVQLALRYDDQRLRGVLTGRHIWWNSSPINNGSYSGIVWDLHLGTTLYRNRTSSLELFFSGRNLFNTSQYTIDIYPNPGRWFEGGLKVGF